MCFWPKFGPIFKLLQNSFLCLTSTLELTTVNQIFSKNHFFGFKGYWNRYFQQKLEIYFCRKITVIFHTTSILLEVLFYILVYCSIFYYCDIFTYWHDVLKYFISCIVLLYVRTGECLLFSCLPSYVTISFVLI